MTLVVAFEGDTDLPVVRKLARDAGIEIAHALDQSGKTTLDRNLLSFNEAAKGSPWLVVRDLDHDAACAPQLLAARSFAPSQWMCFRLAVREVESWLLADHEAIARYFRLRGRSALPSDTDGLTDPRRTLVDLARGSSSRAVRGAMVPKAGESVGPLYQATIIEFGRDEWDLGRACGRSPSLRRAREALRELASRWQRHAAGEA